MAQFRKFGTTIVTMASVATVVLLVTGWGSAAASNISSVFVTNDAAHAVPVTPQGTSKVAEQNLDGSGNMKVHEQGTATVSIANTSVPVREQGTITTQAATPSNAFSVTSGSGTTGIGCESPLPAGTAWHISSLSGSYQPDDPTTTPARVSTVLLQEFPRGDLRGGDGPSLTVPVNDTRELTFPQPFTIVAPGSGYCLFVFIDGGFGTNNSVSIVGYRD